MKKNTYNIINNTFSKFLAVTQICLRFDNQKLDSYMKNLEIVEDLVVKNEADYASTLQLNPSIYDQC